MITGKDAKETFIVTLKLVLLRKCSLNQSKGETEDNGGMQQNSQTNFFTGKGKYDFGSSGHYWFSTLFPRMLYQLHEESTCCLIANYVDYTLHFNN